MEIRFEDLGNADLHIDCIYKAGPASNLSSEVLSRLLPKCGNAGGFRPVLRADGSGKYAYVVLFTTMAELEWPDYLDKETGIFRYYGDNRTPGQSLTDTKKGGNKLLESVFATLNSGIGLGDIPPFLVFQKSGTGRDMQFLGIAAPGNSKISPDRDLVAFWRTYRDDRFQNYEAYFTILNTENEPISRKWLTSLIYDHENSLQYAPPAWRRFVNHGRNGIDALKAKRLFDIPTRYDQLQSDDEGRRCLQMIRDHYMDNPYGFEACATDIVSKMDGNFVDFSLTRPWRDGGRDAVGYYSIGTGRKTNWPLKFNCALEAKCYAENHGVGVRQMSRLISRIRYRQFGIMVTTSYVDKQAYSEVVEDEHPILIVTATDIASILRANQIGPSNIDEWFEAVNGNKGRYKSEYLIPQESNLMVAETSPLFRTYRK